jgi:hypothetical protein
MITYGDIQDVLKSYGSIVLDELDNNDKQLEDNTVRGEYAEIFDVEVSDGQKKNSSKFSFGDVIRVSYKIDVKRTLTNPIFGVTVWQKNVDKAVLATNTLIDGHKETGVFKKGDIITFEVELPSHLNNAEYIIEPAIANDSATIFYDQKFHAATFFIEGGNNPHSIISFNEKSTYTVKKPKRG